jgi:hypothetical protein
MKRITRTAIAIIFVSLLSVFVSGCCFGFLHHCDTDEERAERDYCESRGATGGREANEIHYQDIPFQIIYQDDDNMSLGEEKIIQQGVKGYKQKTFTYAYGANSNDVYKCNVTESQWEVKQEPVNQIVARGTIVAAIVPEPPPASSSADTSGYYGACSCYDAVYYPECQSYYEAYCTSDVSGGYGFGGYSGDDSGYSDGDISSGYDFGGYSGD